ncbi:hypothetical protein [Nocardia amamiensis]|nr:hypothetical protein [Nocardia amamiensis]
MADRHLVEYPAVGIRAYLNGGTQFSEHGWNTPATVSHLVH